MKMALELWILRFALFLICFNSYVCVDVYVLLTLTGILPVAGSVTLNVSSADCVSLSYS